MRKFMIKTLLILLAASGLFIWLRSDASVLAGATALGLDDTDNWLAAQSQDPKPFNLLEAAGTTMLRIRLPFNEISYAPGSFVWSYQSEAGYVDYSQLFKRLERRGIHPVVVLAGGPAYANHLYPQQPIYREELLESWGSYVRAVVEQFGGQVDYWQIGGMLNDPTEWGRVLFPAANSPSAPPDPELYSEILKRAYTVIKSAQASDTVLLGGLALGGDCAFHPLTYLQALHNLDAWYAFDTLSIELPQLLGAPESAQVDICGYIPVQSSGMPAADSLRAIGDFAQNAGGKPIWAYGPAFSDETLAAAAAERGTLPEVVESDYSARLSGILLAYGGAERVFWGFAPQSGKPGGLALQSFANLNQTLGGTFENRNLISSDENLRTLRFRGNGGLTLLIWRIAGGDAAPPALVPNLDGFKLHAFSADAASLKTKHGIELDVDVGGGTALLVSERPVIISGRPGDLKQSTALFLKDSASQAGEGLKSKLASWAQAQKANAAEKVGAWVDVQQQSLMQMLRDSFNQWLRKNLGLAKG